jgi:hypothetical protein
MGFSQIVTAVSVFVVGLLPASCHHKAPAKTTAPAVTASAGVNGTSVESTNSADVLHDLGEVTMTNRLECCVPLGGGKECIFKPKLVDRNNAEIVVTYETRMPGGKIHDMIVTQIDAKNGDAADITVGDFQLTLTPNIVSE